MKPPRADPAKEPTGRPRGRCFRARREEGQVTPAGVPRGQEQTPGQEGLEGGETRNDVYHIIAVNRWELR
jgi:hypothetical protein